MGQITILSIGLFILLLLSFFLSEFNFFSPSFIICLMFTFGSILALYAIGAWNIPDSIFSYKATWIILSGILVFIICEQITKKIAKRGRIEKSPEHIPSVIHISSFKYSVLLIIAIVGTILYVYGVYKKVKANGYSGGFDFRAIGSYNHMISFWDEKEGGINRIIRLVQQAAQIIMYILTYIFIYNVVYCKSKIRKNIKYLIPTVTWLPNIFITSSRGSYLQLAGACVFYFYIMLCRRNNWKRMHRSYKKIIKYAVILFIFVIVLFYAGVSSGAIGRQTNKNLLDYVTVYVGAPIIHFNQFITNPPSDVKYFGQETFNKLLPVFNRWGLIDGQVSGQLERRVITGIYHGNVYTFFRRPLHDFGYLGMYIIVALTSVIFSYIYYNKIYGKQKNYKNDRTLIIYSYFFYIIYIFSIDYAIYLYFYFGIIYFLIMLCILYEFTFGNKIRIKGKK